MSILDLNVKVAWVCLILATPVYVGLYMYLDAIMPNVYGIRQSCCFCFKKNRNLAFEEEMIEDGENLVPAKPVAIKIKSLTKLYGTTRAADSLNFNVYKNEVFTLLGHNGAGKTTAISMLTGMI